MRVLFDQGVPLPLRRYLDTHVVRLAEEEGWARLANGSLLTVAEEAGFDLLLTTDKNMSYQQNLSGRKIAIRVLGLQQWPALRPHVPLVLQALEEVTPGSFAEIEMPPLPPR
jgi:hypothetical protein